MWAALITALPLVGGAVAMRRVVYAESWLAPVLSLVELPLWPGMFVASFAGNRGGPDGMPSVPAMFVGTFVFWWAAIAIVRWIFEKPPRAGTA
jgi:predicted permease